MRNQPEKANCKARQIALSLTLPESRLFSLERFCENERNRIAVKTAKSFGKKASSHALTIVGPAQSGKSHLLKGIYLQKRPRKSSAYVSCNNLAGAPRKFLRESIFKLGKCELVCLDNLDAPGANPQLYDEVFHLFNRLVDSGRHLAVAMRVSPARAGFLPDYLSSRLLSGMVVRVEKPDSAQKAEILKKLAEDRCVSFTPRALKFIMERSPRSVNHLGELVDLLEKNLAGGEKRIGLQLIRRVIKSETG